MKNKVNSFQRWSIFSLILFLMASIFTEFSLRSDWCKNNRHFAPILFVFGASKRNKFAPKSILLKNIFERAI